MKQRTVVKVALRVVALVVLAVLVAVVAGTFTRKTFLVETIVPATPQQVWAVLMATSDYPNWNPVFIEVRGQVSPGSTLRNTVRGPDGKILEITSTVKTLTPHKELRQTGGIPGIMTFDHQWLLEPVAEGTKVTQHEVDRGLFLWFWESGWIEPAYKSVNEALGKQSS